MQLIVDLHQHSHFSRATSKESTLEGLYKWGKIKGTHIIGTGDFTHPGWFKELQEKLVPAEQGLFRLRDDIAAEVDRQVHPSCRENMIRFVLTVEISNIYSKNGKVRKLHNVIIVPSFEAASEINQELEKIGNLKADGRPILGMDSKRLLEITIQTNPDNLFIPAHIWTPWFGMFGSKSGFDTLAEAFEDLVPEIKAIETGLSSDPQMNWRIADLDGLTIVSHSDAHSPQKLGREANIINSQLSYDDILGAIRTNDERFIGTVEFFPEEGKYHYDGHRACSIRFTGEETQKHGGICPICKKPLTVGVDYRVNQLATRDANYRPSNPKKVEYIIPLAEILGEIHGVGVGSKTVRESYDHVYATLGSEFSILRTIPIEQIDAAGFPQLALAVDKLRRREVYLDPGYDGVYGTIRVFKDSEQRQKSSAQLRMFG